MMRSIAGMLFECLSIFAPLSARILGRFKGNGALAQLVEQRIENPCVPSSILGGTTKKTPAMAGVFSFRGSRMLAQPGAHLLKVLLLKRFAQSLVGLSEIGVPFQEAQLQLVPIMFSAQHAIGLHLLE